MYTIFSIHDGQSRLTFCKSSREIFKNSIETIVFPVIPYKRVFRIQFLVIPCFNANNVTFELTAGLTYHFKMSTGNHYFTKVKVYNQSEIDDLNVAINALREQVGSRDRELNNANQRISGLHKELEECRTKVVPIETVVKTARVPESIITFRQGRSSVDASQLPNVERVASYMKKYPDSKVIIKGYASPEGNVEINAKIATARAEAVKTILVNKYKINTSRITAEDQGVGDMFTEPDWNRVSICTIED